MLFHLISDTEWAYPDNNPVSESGEIILDAALGGHAGFQFLGGLPADSVSVIWEDEPLITEIFSMLPVRVDENTSPTLMTTTDYESCKAYVTRKAPFEVYDALLPWNQTEPGQSRAFYIRLRVPEAAAPGLRKGTLIYKAGTGCLQASISPIRRRPGTSLSRRERRICAADTSPTGTSGRMRSTTLYGMEARESPP